MKMTIILLVGLLTCTNFAFGKAYYINQPLVKSTGTEKYQMEFESYNKNSNEWILGNNDKLCFGTDTDCYTSVGDFIGTVAIPNPDSDKPIIITNYEYGIHFEEPKNNLVEVNSFSTIKKKVGDSEVWEDVIPNLYKSKTNIAVGAWFEIEFHTTEGTKKLKARIIPISKN